MLALVKSDAWAIPAQYVLRSTGCLASRPKPTSRWVLPPPMACFRWKTAWEDAPARRATPSLMRSCMPCVIWVFPKNSVPSPSAVINWSSCSIRSLSLIESALGWSSQASRTVFKFVLRGSTRVPQCFDTGEVRGKRRAHCIGGLVSNPSKRLTSPLGAAGLADIVPVIHLQAGYRTVSDEYLL